MPLHTWRYHHSHYQSINVTKAEENIFSASKSGLSTFNTITKEIQILSKNNVLNDANIHQLAYDKKYKAVIIGYTNGNIDILKEKVTINIPHILLSSFENKTIHKIFVKNGIAYIGTPFGLIVLDIKREEITASFIYHALPMQVYDIDMVENLLYIATSKGIFSFPLNTDKNFQDISHWNEIKQSLPLAPVTKIGALFEKVFFFSDSKKRMYRLENGVIQLEESLKNIVTCYEITNYEDEIFICSKESIVRYRNEETIKEIRNEYIKEPRKVIYEDPILWVSDVNTGLLKIENGGVEQIFSTGVFGYDYKKLKSINGNVWAMSGGFDQKNYNKLNKKGVISYFQKNKWNNITFGENYFNIKKTDPLEDITDIALTEKHYYIGSFGDGLYKLSIEGNSLEKIPLFPSAKDIFITSLEYDNNGKVWATAHSSGSNKNTIFSFDIDKNLTHVFSFPSISGVNYPLKIFIDSQANKWILLSSNIINGIFVFDDDERFRIFSDRVAMGNLPDKNVNCIVEDKNKKIWIGTNNGVGIILLNNAIYTNNFYLPRVNGLPLLNGIKINDIAVDGANNKWIGTDNGVFVVNEEGSEQIYFFSQSNSALPSNKIISIAVEEMTGEIFFLTDKGIASYQSENTSASRHLSSLFIYPNPVPFHYDGKISIGNLVDKAWVKITDTSGNLVYETEVRGGTFSWEGTDLHNNKVQEGIYLVFSISPDGKQSAVSKLAIIR